MPHLITSSHVQINNDEAIAFYERSGFSIVGEKKDYYKRIDPPDAYVLQKNLKDLKSDA